MLHSALSNLSAGVAGLFSGYLYSGTGSQASLLLDRVEDICMLASTQISST